jgi:fructokinase
MRLGRTHCRSPQASGNRKEDLKVQIVSLGEVLWDVFGENEFLGGAPLNFSANLQRLGNAVALLTAVGMDSRGARTLAEMDKLGLTTEFVQTVDERPTGTATVVTDSSGNASFVIERPAAFDCIQAGEELFNRLRNLRPDWIYYGTLAQTEAHTEQILFETLRRCAPVKCFYDMNLRTGHWNLPLLQRLSRAATVLKLNETEAEHLFFLTFGSQEFSLEDFCRYWSSTYGIEVVCVTLGSKGCAVFAADSLHTFAGYSVRVADTVGAGDAFAAAFLHGLNAGWPMQQIAEFANALGALVASRPGATPNWTIDECLQMVAADAAKPA